MKKEDEFIAKTIGGAVWALRFRWTYRHAGSTKAQKRVARERVRANVRRLREAREAWPHILPRLPEVCGGDGTTARRHLWGPKGPDPCECACLKCQEDVRRSRRLVAESPMPEGPGVAR